MTPEPLCIHCGKTADDHCVFETKAMPAGCVCAPGEWGDRITPICDKFVGDLRYACHVCEHDDACHVNRAALESKT